MDGGTRCFVVCGRQAAESEIELAFSQVGPVLDVKMVRDKGVAYVTFQKASHAALAIESLHQITLNEGRGPQLKVFLAHSPGTQPAGGYRAAEASSDPDNTPPRSRLFVVVPKSADPRLIEGAMQRYPGLEPGGLKTDLIASKGVVFVKFERASAALEALEDIQSSGTLAGLRVKAMLAEPKMKRTCGPGMGPDAAHNSAPYPFHPPGAADANYGGMTRDPVLPDPFGGAGMPGLPGLGGGPSPASPLTSMYMPESATAQSRLSLSNSSLASLAGALGGVSFSPSPVASPSPMHASAASAPPPDGLPGEAPSGTGQPSRDLPALLHNPGLHTRGTQYTAGSASDDSPNAFAHGPGSEPWAAAASADADTLRVGDQTKQRLFLVVHRSATEGAITRLFQQVPGLEYCDLKRDRFNGKSKGYCYVHFNSPASAAMAIQQFNGLEFPPKSAHRMKVMYAEPPGVRPNSVPPPQDFPPQHNGQLPTGLGGGGSDLAGLQMPPLQPGTPSMCASTPRLSNLTNDTSPESGLNLAGASSAPQSLSSSQTLPGLKGIQQGWEHGSLNWGVSDPRIVYTYLPQPLPDYAVQHVFKQCAPVDWVVLQVDDPRYGMVRLGSVEAARNAVARLNRTDVLGQQLSVDCQPHNVVPKEEAGRGGRSELLRQSA